VLACGEYLFCDVLQVHNVEKNRKASFGNRAGFFIGRPTGAHL
jgi:hypothetical protein